MESNAPCSFKKEALNRNLTSPKRSGAGRTAGLRWNECGSISPAKPNHLKSRGPHGMARCFNARSPRWDCDARPRAGSAHGCLNHLRVVEFRRVTFSFHPGGRLAQAAACKAAKAGAIPARDSISPGISVERYTPVFQTGIARAIPSCPSISQVNLACRQRPRTVEGAGARPPCCHIAYAYPETFCFHYDLSL